MNRNILLALLKLITLGFYYLFFDSDMKKFLFLLFPLLNINSCVEEDDYYDNTYCWECECTQLDETWTEVFHLESEQFISDFIFDDSQELPPIYTRCYKFSCPSHPHSHNSDYY